MLLIGRIFARKWTDMYIFAISMVEVELIDALSSMVLGPGTADSVRIFSVFSVVVYNV